MPFFFHHVFNVRLWTSVFNRVNEIDPVSLQKVVTINDIPQNLIIAYFTAGKKILIIFKDDSQ